MVASNVDLEMENRLLSADLQRSAAELLAHANENGKLRLQLKAAQGKIEEQKQQLDKSKEAEQESKRGNQNDQLEAEKVSEQKRALNKS